MSVLSVAPARRPSSPPPPFLSQSEVVKCVIDDVARAHKKGNTPTPSPSLSITLLSCVANVLKGALDGGGGAVQRIQLAILLTFWTKQLQNVQQECQVKHEEAVAGREGGTEAKISTVKVQDERVTTCKTSDKRNGSQVEAKRKRKLCMQHNARKKWAKKEREKEVEKRNGRGGTREGERGMKSEVAEAKANIMLTIWQAAC